MTPDQAAVGFYQQQIVSLTHTGAMQAMRIEELASQIRELKAENDALKRGPITVEEK